MNDDSATTRNKKTTGNRRRQLVAEQQTQRNAMQSACKRYTHDRRNGSGPTIWQTRIFMFTIGYINFRKRESILEEISKIGATRF